MLGIVLCVFLPLSHGSLYDPHLFPKHGPFMEGWYMRIEDPVQNEFLAILFGTVLPKDPTKAKNLAFVGFLRSSKNEPKLKNWDTFPDINKVNITFNDNPVSHNPDIKSPPNFKFEADGVGYVKVTGKGTVFDLTVADVRFSCRIGKPYPWDDDELGPGGWTDYLPLPLAWFVYSIASPVETCTWTDKSNSETFTLNSGYVHMEKNWGATFPSAWVWSQGIETIHAANTEPSSHNSLHTKADGLTFDPINSNHNEIADSQSLDSYAYVRSSHNGDTRISTKTPNVPPSNLAFGFAMAYGPIHLGPIPITGHLVGYKHPGKNIALSFNPTNSYFSETTDGCRGFINITIIGINSWTLYKLEINVVESNLDVFSNCLYGPGENGFRLFCKESYTSVAKVTVSAFSVWKMGFELVDRVTIDASALEFGGKYVCNDTCG